MPQFTVNLPGGGQQVVNASSAAAAAGNVGGGATVANVQSGNQLHVSAPPPAPAPAPMPASAAPRPAAAQAAAPAAVPAPVSGAAAFLANTNDQANRAALRNLGYYIDDSGVYAPGSGARVQDTYSGVSAALNTPPSPTRLPVIGGTPVSPSTAQTGTPGPAIMYSSDPLYPSYFGPGTPGFSSTPGANTVAAPAAAQGILPVSAAAAVLGANGLPQGANPADYGFGIAAADGVTLGQQTAAVQLAWVNAFGKGAGQAFATQRDQQIGAGGSAQGATGAAGQSGAGGAGGAGGSAGGGGSGLGAAPLDFSGITSALTAPSPLFGLPMWEAAVGAFVAFKLFSSSGSGRRRRLL